MVMIVTNIMFLVFLITSLHIVIYYISFILRLRILSKLYVFNVSLSCWWFSLGKIYVRSVIYLVI